ncbi:lipid II flippase MurJ [Streptomyces sp. NPDC001985]|uniref:lipid II flippase MurJ n=1 Tax=Streptomyces sp. NPDC001985 TaxID=3154406 RepID=UPI0033167B92
MTPGQGTGAVAVEVDIRSGPGGGAAGEAAGERQAPHRLGNVLARAAAVTAGLTVAGAVLGLVRDQTIAKIYGASTESDAFLIAWTVPEMAATLLIEDAMALLLVPAFSHALTRRAAMAATASPAPNASSASSAPGASAAGGAPVALAGDAVSSASSAGAASVVLAGGAVSSASSAGAASSASSALAAGGASVVSARDAASPASPASASAGSTASSAAAPPASSGAAAPPDASRAGGGDPVQQLVAATLPRLLAVLTGVTGLLILFAPQFVSTLAPGFADPALAVDCTRLTALTVLTYGIAGYFSAALRAHGRFLPPAGVYIASNVGIIATTLLLNSLWGVRAAATGVAVGGLLMVLTQLPAFLSRVSRVGRVRPSRRTVPRAPRAAATSLVGFAVVAPIVLFAVSRQSQVLVERFIASSLPGGAISHLNYAQKVAQMPMVLSLMFCTVTFPVIARAMADGDHERARRRVENDLVLAGLVVLLGTALILGCAHQIVEVLFERGAFDAHDTATTASVMRVYAAGLIGHTLVGALGRPFFSTGRPTWYPAAAMGAGLLVTVAAGWAAAGPWGVYGIAAANAAGICATALLLLHGLGSRGIAIEVRAISAGLARLAAAAAVAALAGRVVSGLIPSPLLGLTAGVLLVPAVFAATGLALRAPEVVHLLALTRQRIRHVR